MKKLLLTAIAVVMLGICKAEEPKHNTINLHLNNSYISNDDNAALGIAMAIGGAALCTALLLEGNSSYASAWKQYDGRYYQDVPPFYLQTPKNAFFVMGASVSVTGVIIAIRNYRSSH